MANENASGQETRPPTIDDLLKLCERLNADDVKYILIGGFAVIYHGFPRATEDIDLLVDSIPSNIDKIRNALSYLPDKASLEIKPDDVEKYSVVRIADEFVIDILKSACDVTFDDAKPYALNARMNGVLIPVADVDTLIKTKQTVRERDKEDVRFLTQLKNEKI